MADPEVVAVILKARGENPDMGAKRLVSFLKDQGTSVSLNAVKKIIQDSDGAGSEGGGRSGVGTQRAFLSAGKVERRDAKIPGCGQGLFATAAVKAGERLFSSNISDGEERGPDA